MATKFICPENSNATQPSLVNLSNVCFYSEIKVFQCFVIGEHIQTLKYHLVCFSGQTSC